MEKIVERIRKLLALAGNNPSEAERESALSKAHALLIEHNLHMHDVADKVEEMAAFDSKFSFRPTPWTRTIVNAIAKLYFCKFVFHRHVKSREFTATFIGMRVDSDIARQVSEAVLTSIKRECQMHVRIVGGGETSFKNAAALAIYHRCEALMAEAQKPSASGNALVVQSLYKTRTAEAEAFAANMFSNLRTTKSKLRIRQDASAQAGSRLGRSVGLTLNVQK